jgi:hypothetical protein
VAGVWVCVWWLEVGAPAAWCVTGVAAGMAMVSSCRWLVGLLRWVEGCGCGCMGRGVCVSAWVLRGGWVFVMPAVHGGE